MSGPKRKFNPTIEELATLYAQMIPSDIAKKYGVGQTVVYNRLREFGITPRWRNAPREFSREHKENISKAHRGRWSGDKNPNWKGGATEKNAVLRRSGEYRQWKLASRERAGNQCEECGIAQGNICKCCGNKILLHVHHIESFAKHPDLRFDPKNSRVLCPKCHHCSHH